MTKRCREFKLKVEFKAGHPGRKRERVMEGYSISQVAARFGVEPHTLRFYEKEGIIHPQRTASGVRSYSEENLAQLEMAMCLKSTGMHLKEIRRYFELVDQGDGTLEERLAIFTDHRTRVLREIEELQKHLAKIEHKIAYLKKQEA